MKRREFVSAATLSTLRFVPALARSGPIGDISAVTTGGSTVTLRSAEVREFAEALKGQLLLRGDTGYEEARLLLNPSFDKYPALVVQPTDVADIQKGGQLRTRTQLAAGCEMRRAQFK